MSHDTQTPQGKSGHKQFNFNTLVMFVVLGAVAWTGDTVFNLSKDVSAIRAVDLIKMDQLGKIQDEQNRQREMFISQREEISRLRIDVQKLKRTP